MSSSWRGFLGALVPACRIQYRCVVLWWVWLRFKDAHWAEGFAVRVQFLKICSTRVGSSCNQNRSVRNRRAYINVTTYQYDKDNIVFRYQATLPGPCQWLPISFNRLDRLRLMTDVGEEMIAPFRKDVRREFNSLLTYYSGEILLPVLQSESQRTNLKNSQSVDHSSFCDSKFTFADIAPVNSRSKAIPGLKQCRRAFWSWRCSRLLNSGASDCMPT